MKSISKTKRHFTFFTGTCEAQQSHSFLLFTKLNQTSIKTVHASHELKCLLCCSPLNMSLSVFLGNYFFVPVPRAAPVSPSDGISCPSSVRLDRKLTAHVLGHIWATSLSFGFTQKVKPNSLYPEGTSAMTVIKSCS